MKKNVGDLDAYLRITGGLTMLGMGITRKSDLLSFLGAMKVAEGVTRFCPMLYLLNLSTNEKTIQINFSKEFNDNNEVESN